MLSFSKSGLPVGLQIVADMYKDKACFELAILLNNPWDWLISGLDVD